ncbi:MAG TPA: undecaprenyl diphosphate synthase family protein, partial [bacterium]|nr:undecaprenyl diphosphate synthase family protein [bacterium]
MYVSTLTLWAFSTENWKRDSAEVQALMQLFSKYLTSKRESFMENGIRF